MNPLGDQGLEAPGSSATDISLVVFLAAIAARTLSTALAVGLGWVVLRTLPLETVKLAAGLGFVLTGCRTIYETFKL